MTARRRRRRTRGVATIEMALVAPFLLVVLFGVGEMGLAWVSSNRLEGAVSTAARTGATSGSVADADRNILLSLRASLPAALLNNVERVVIYKSDENGYIHPSCRTFLATGVSGQCNIYSGSTLAAITLATPDISSQGSYWPSSSRRDTLAGPPDYLGVLVITRHDDVTGTFWRAGFAIERSSVYRLSPSP